MRHAELAVRYAWFAVVGLTLIVPGALIGYGYEFNAHSTSTVGGPVTFGLCISIAAAFVVLLWLAFGLLLISRSARRAAGELRSGGTRV